MDVKISLISARGTDLGEMPESGDTGMLLEIIKRLVDAEYLDDGDKIRIDVQY